MMRPEVMKLYAENLVANEKTSRDYNPLEQFSTNQLKAEIRRRKKENRTNNLTQREPKLSVSSNTVQESSIMVHGGMKYKCESCGKEWFMSLEIGVEDHGKNGRPHQPSPFTILCGCGGFATDISGYIPLPGIRPILPGMRYFAYDHSGNSRACGHPSVYHPGDSL